MPTHSDPMNVSSDFAANEDAEDDLGLCFIVETREQLVGAAKQRSAYAHR